MMGDINLVILGVIIAIAMVIFVLKFKK